ncbi:hypothetical protein DUK53_15060 [Listeria sp. SHR_NRA_18]|uniref:hypothetical protein n=1 Tax=Listeria sp. SHR_NRA_18 TaxID=2269046 RepID=UPI000F5EE785|nr:hypothetical protein [Listeria sp. SHR_NRA_18]RQW65707.1 hypothetical protein DUK53_15060 [Listeria sp. SHR_NRA_18]
MRILGLSITEFAALCTLIGLVLRYGVIKPNRAQNRALKESQEAQNAALKESQKANSRALDLTLRATMEPLKVSVDNLANEMKESRKDRSVLNGKVADHETRITVLEKAGKGGGNR